MDVNGACWYVDAWSVRDGAIFVTRRNSGDEFENGSNTVFMCIPDLEPISVGRRSTALSATRRHSQDGLTDLDTGEEIAFADLEQVKDLVRRGYLAGGLGPDGPTDPDPEPRPVNDGGDDGDSSRGAEYYEDQVVALADKGQDTHSHTTFLGKDPAWTDGEDPARDLHALAELTRADPNNADTSALASLVAAYARAVMIDWRRRVWESHDTDDLRMLKDWSFVQFVTGVDGYPSWDDFEPHCIGRFGRILRPWVAPEVNLASLVYAAPCPLRPTWDPRLRRLRDKVAWPMVDASYFRENNELPELAPAVVGALTMTALQIPITILDDQRPEREHLRIRLAFALDWLADQLPARVHMPEAADRALAKYAVDRLISREL